jgi:ligand-binding sensor domain-containing protein
MLIHLSACEKNLNTLNNDYDKRDWVNYLNNYSITSIAEEGDYMWIGTNESGLIKLEKSSGNSIFYNIENSSIPSNNIESIAIEKNSIKWIGTWNGLAKIGGNTWEIFTESNSDISGSFIRAIAIDSKNIKWIGCANGLSRYANSKWTVFNKNNSNLSSDKILSLATDHQNNVWIGTQNYGFVEFDGTNFSVFDTTNSLIPSNYIQSMLVDINNNKWVGTREIYYDGDLILYKVTISFRANNIIQFEEEHYDSSNIRLNPSPYENLPKRFRIDIKSFS